MRRHAFVPSSPAFLEERITPSHSGLASAGPTSPAIAPSQNVNLYGFALGHEVTRGTVLLLRSTEATISPVGKVSLSGYLVVPIKGRVHRPAQGIVSLSNGQGKITVSLKGTVTVSNGVSRFVSGNLTYKIVSATKSDHGAEGTGPVLFSLGGGPLPSRYLIDFGNYPPPP